MLVLVTGARGFIGRQLVPDLAQRGHTVHACTRGVVGSPASDRIRWHQIDLTTADHEWQDVLRGVDAVVHLGAQVHVMGALTEEQRRSFAETNTVATQRLADNARKVGVKRFVFVSSVKVFGEATGTRAFSSGDSPKPSDDYGRSKLAAEEYLRALGNDANGLECAIVRPPLVFGPGVRANFLRLMDIVYWGIPLPLAGIQNRRSLISVWNLSDLLVRCVEAERVPRAPLLVCDERSVSTPELLGMIARAMGRRARLFRVPPQWLRLAARVLGREQEFERLTESLEVDASVAHNELGWRPPLSIEEGIERTARWYPERSR